MAKYTVQMSYNATITLVVDADEEHGNRLSVALPVVGADYAAAHVG